MFFEIVDQLQVNVGVLVVVEGERGDQVVEVFHKIAKNRDFVLLLNQVDRAQQKLFLQLVVL